MNERDKKYDKLISRIRSGEPELDDPYGLTSGILSAVEKQPARPNIMPLRVVSWMSSVAAVLLLGVFLQGRSMPIAPSTQQLNISSFGSYSLEGIDIEEGRTLDKVNVIVREKRKLRQERETFYSDIANKYKTVNESDDEDNKNNSSSIYCNSHGVLRHVLQDDDYTGSRW